MYTKGDCLLIILTKRFDRLKRTDFSFLQCFKRDQFTIWLLLRCSLQILTPKETWFFEIRLNPDIAFHPHVVVLMFLLLYVRESLEGLFTNNHLKTILRGL